MVCQHFWQHVYRHVCMPSAHTRHDAILRLLLFFYRHQGDFGQIFHPFSQVAQGRRISENKYQHNLPIIFLSTSCSIMAGTKAFNLHCVSTYKIHYSPFCLSGTQRVVALQKHLFFNNITPAHRTPFRHIKLLHTTGALLFDDLDYLRNNLSSLLNNDVITYTNILSLDFRQNCEVTPCSQ